MWDEAYFHSDNSVGGLVQHFDDVSTCAAAQLAQLLQVVYVRAVLHSIHIQFAAHLKI